MEWREERWEEHGAVTASKTIEHSAAGTAGRMPAHIGGIVRTNASEQANHPAGASGSARLDESAELLHAVPRGQRHFFGVERGDQARSAVGAAGKCARTGKLIAASGTVGAAARCKTGVVHRTDQRAAVLLQRCRGEAAAAGAELAGTVSNHAACTDRCGLIYRKHREKLAARAHRTHCGVSRRRGNDLFLCAGAQ